MTLTPELVIQLLGYAAILGIGWWRLVSLEGAVDGLKQDLTGDIKNNNELIRQQNSRLDSVEQWQREREGYERGWQAAKRKYEKQGDGL